MPEAPIDTLMLGCLVFAAAALYSTVGHGGASSYLAVMTLLNVFGGASDPIKSTALVLNILVSLIATVRFCKPGYFSWPVFWPLAIASVPLALLGGLVKLPDAIYKQIVGVVLIWASVRLLTASAATADVPTRRAPVSVALLVGAAIGLLSGAVGVGGGIFLSPLLVLMRWATPRETTGISALFILVNSLAGLGGFFYRGGAVPGGIWLLMLPAVAGGLIGSELGSRQLGGLALRRVLGVGIALASVKLLLV